jgi:hypothetical protein
MNESRGGVLANDQEISDVLEKYPNFPNPAEDEKHRTYVRIVSRLGPDYVDKKTYDITTRAKHLTARPKGQKSGVAKGTLGERITLGTKRNSHDYVIDEIVHDTTETLLVEYLGRSDNHKPEPDRQMISKTNGVYELTIPALPITHMSTPGLRKFAENLYSTAKDIASGQYSKPATNQLDMFNE